MLRLCRTNDVVGCLHSGSVSNDLGPDPLQESSRPNHVINESEEKKLKLARKAEHDVQNKRKQEEEDIVNPLQQSSRKNHDIDKVLETIEVSLDQNELTSQHSTDTSINSDVEKLRVYLLKAGIEEFSFVPVKERNEEQYSHVLNTQCILWEYSNTKEDEDNQLYIMTVVHIDDSVDEDMVVKNVLSSLSDRMKFQSILKMEKDYSLRRTEPDTAERITGYQIDAMPPIGLAEPMMFLFVDEKLGRRNSEARNDERSKIVGIGSGSLEFDLHISTDHIMRMGGIEHLMGVQTCALSRQE